MNARLAKLALTLCSLSLLTASHPLQAQDTNDGQVSQPPGYANGRRGPGNGGPSESTYDLPTFDIQIENGKLSLAPLAPLANHPELTNFWALDAKTVPATMENISLYLRATDPHLSVILSPGTGDATISNLKIKTAMLPQISDAIFIASGNTVSGNGGFRGRGGFGGNGRSQNGESTIAFTRREQAASRPTMEVFNLSGYIQTLGKFDDKVVREKIDELQNLTQSTLTDLGHTSDDFPNFRYHPGTKLLIVIGKPEAIDVTSKIVNALAGQQTNGKADLLETMPPSGQN